MAKTRAKTLLTAAAIGRNFGVSKSTVCTWIHKGCPQTTIDAVSKWRAANINAEKIPFASRKNYGTADSGEPREPSISERRTLADTRKINSDVELRQLRLREKLGDLVSHKEIERELAEWAIRIKERLIASPSEFFTRWPLEVRDQTNADFIEWIRQLLLEMSRWKVLGVSMDDHIIAAGDRLKAERAAAAN